MFLSVFKKSKNMLRPAAVLLLLGFALPVWAAGPPAPSIFSNPLAVTLFVLMTLLLIIIGILANILLGAADIKMKKSKKGTGAAVISMMLAFLLLSSTSLFAQNNTVATQTATTAIGGMSSGTFYVMASVIFLELTLIIALLINIKLLLKVEKEKVAVAEIKIVTEEEKKSRLSWWDKFNKLRPVTEEAELDLGHDYDGIRELNNRLPPWWLYGFYLTIIIGVIYFWRYQVSHSAPSSREEFEIAVANGDREVAAYLKMRGDNVDENTVTLLTDPADINAGKEIFMRPTLCNSCHGMDGSGMINGSPGVGPDLTDDYWLHGGRIKDVFTTIKYGVTGKGMREWESMFSPKEIAQLASYVKSLHGTNPPVHKEPAGQLYKEEQPAPSKPGGDSIKMMNDSIKAKDNKVVMNK